MSYHLVNMKIRNIIFVLAVVLSTLSFVRAQDIYVATESEINFFSGAILEDIEATTSKAVSAINIATDEIFVKIPIRSFHFNNSLMQEHFNENFLESHKFPYGTFKGKIIGDVDYETNGVYPTKVVGILTIHGVPQEKTFNGTITVKNGEFAIYAKFVVPLVEHDVDIPKMLLQNIAEKITVTITANYEIYRKSEN